MTGFLVMFYDFAVRDEFVTAQPLHPEVWD